MLLQYCKKGNPKILLKYSNPPVTLSRKKRWAAQIAHGLQSIHGAGSVHGDLRCENVVVDEFDNAHLIDITNDEGFTDDLG
jgi:serine/threonine protein kinase